ncbi:hypothetical protein [Mesorhizobium loti]|uniref:hypothetical protein n=1 Tax=Rhizobium loti TaxID=381 RepID=UPI000A601799|nr:hypothetical protein [Mesorhizobium loti]
MTTSVDDASPDLNSVKPLPPGHRRGSVEFRDARRDARRYLESHNWVSAIKGEYLGYRLDGVICKLGERLAASPSGRITHDQTTKRISERSSGAQWAFAVSRVRPEIGELFSDRPPAQTEHEALVSQQSSAKINWQWRLATCDPAEYEALAAQSTQEDLAWEKKTGCKVHVLIDKKALRKYLRECDSPNVGSPELRAWARNYPEDE